MNDIMEIVEAIEDSNFLLKGMTKTIKNETKEQKGGFLSMLLDTLGASLLGDLLAKKLSGKGTVRAGEESLRAGEGIKKKALMQQILQQTLKYKNITKMSLDLMVFILEIIYLKQ